MALQFASPLEVAVLRLLRSFALCVRCKEEGRAPSYATFVSCLHEDDDGHRGPVCDRHSLVGDTFVLDGSELARMVELLGPAAQPGGPR